MNMIYQARVIAVSTDIEELVVVEIEGLVLTCFAVVCPYRIECGSSYPVTLELWSLEGLELQDAETMDVSMQQIGDGFRYRIVGCLNGDVLDAGIKFVDEVFSREYGYLSGHGVVVEVDRIQITFD